MRPTSDAFFSFISPVKLQKLPQHLESVTWGRVLNIYSLENNFWGVTVLFSDAIFYPKLSKPFAVAPRSALEHLPEVGEHCLHLLARERPGKGKSV